MRFVTLLEYSTMSSKRPLSLALSLINQYFIAVSTLCGIGTERTFLHQIDITAKQFLQVHQHAAMCEEREGLAGTVRNEKNVDVTPRCLLASGEGAEEPCLQDWLSLEIVGYRLLHHLCTHKRVVLVSGDKDTTFFADLLRFAGKSDALAELGGRHAFHAAEETGEIG